jgi:uncharacterized protein YciI
MEPSSDAPPFELDRFELVWLKRPAEPTIVSEEEADRLQELHLAYLLGLTTSGDIRVCGPFDEQRDQSFRGMALYQTGSIERTRELASADPAVVAGRLEVEVMYFYCPRGSI